MTADSKQTTDHEEIKRWAKDRGGKPAAVATTGSDNDPGILRIDFEGYGADADDPNSQLEEITWDDFFAKFEDNNLAFLYQEETAAGETSRFYKLVSR